MSAAGRAFPHTTCLGCGCACDDIEIVVRDERIVDARGACPLGVAWFGDGRVSSRSLVHGKDATVEEALDAMATLLADASHPLVYLAPEVTCEGQREAVALADALRGALDSVTSATAMASLLATQERGRAGATLGEVRHRADLLLFWAVDPTLRYPRYGTRYAPEPAGIHLPEGRRARTVIAVDVGDARGPADADHRFALLAAGEVAALTSLRSAIEAGQGSLDLRLQELSSMLLASRYPVIVIDSEADSPVSGRDPHWVDALLALAHSLNGPTRCAVSVLRAGGNRTGADAVMAWQTGYPAAVDFARGYPRYRPYDGSASARLSKGELDAVLVIGSAALIPEAVASMMARVDVATIGPRASESALSRGVATIDTGVAGIHETGTALRMDDVPLPLRAPLNAPRATTAIAQALRERIVAMRRNAGAGERKPGFPFR